MRGRRVVVVGAGFGGLAAAVRLAAAGLDVTICERAAQPGGCAGRLTLDGYAFDTGPSVLTMPELLDDVFAAAGEQRRDHLELVRLDPAYRAVFHDGSEIAVRGSVEAMAEEVARTCGGEEAVRFRRFVAHLGALYDAEFGDFIDANFDSALDLARPRQLARLVRLGGFRRLHDLVAERLTDWRLVRLFSFQSMYAGLSPYEALGLYAVIAYMDTVKGVYGVRGGVHAVAEALAGLAVRAGVELRLSTPVSQIEVASGRAVAVRTAHGDRLPCDVVVANADLPIVYRDLLPPGATPRRVRSLRYSPSCVVVHLGLDRRLEGVAHHNVHFARAYRESFDDLLAGRPQRDPSWFCSVPTVTDPTLAPPGGAVAFHLVPTPNLHGAPVDWDARADVELEAAQTRMEAAGYGPVRDATVVGRVVTPAGWARAGLAAGTPFSASHRFAQTGPFRPANVAPKVGGVVFAGAGTTPGVGIPMVLLSGRLAAERVRRLLRHGVHARPVGP